MAAIAYDTLIPNLLDRVPEFHPDEEFARENLTSLVLDELMRFVIPLLVDPKNDEVLRRVFELLEEAVNLGDPRIDEMLQDSFQELAVRAEPETAKRQMRAATRRLFEGVEDSIYTSPQKAAVKRIIRSIRHR